MAGFEDHPLLGQKPRQRLKERAAQREENLRKQIESAAARLRQLGKDTGTVTGTRKRAAAEAALRQTTVELRQATINIAAVEAGDGVREFADGLLSTQGRLAAHASLLRDYTARLIRQIRERVGSSELFESESLSPWLQDPIAQSGMRACEDVLEERRSIEMPSESAVREGQQGSADSGEGTPLVWPAVVQEWEGQKAAKGDGREQYEQIREADFRKLVAGRHGVRTEDVTPAQVDQVAIELCRHYERFRVIPDPSAGEHRETDEAYAPGSAEDESFWKEREDEFRKHDVGQNADLFVWWFSMDDRWVFRTGPGVNSPSTDTLHVFKSLASLAARGLSGDRSAEPWVEWLNLLRRAKDDRTGKPSFAKVGRSESSVSASEVEERRLAGEPIWAGGLIEYVEVDASGGVADQRAIDEGAETGRLVDKRIHWNSVIVTIEHLFKSSANYCLKLRSLAPRRSADVRDTVRHATSSIQGPIAQRIRLNRPSRQETEQLAKNKFTGACKRILKEQEDSKRQALERARETHNSGAYLPTMVNSAAEKVRAMILGLAESYFEAFTLYGVPAETWAQDSLQKRARQVAAGAISGVRGELKQRAGRLRIPEEGQGLPWHLEIEGAMGDALDEGKLLLEEQRIKFRATEMPLQAWPPVATDAGAVWPTGHGPVSSGAQVVDAALPDVEAEVEGSHQEVEGSPSNDRVAVPHRNSAARPALDVHAIETWMDDQGWTNETLARKLKVSKRTISSIRNNGKYHGDSAITKLANLMGRNPEDLYMK